MRDRGSPPSSLCEDKTFMGAAPLSFWSLVGELKFSLGDFGELERLCDRQKRKICVVSGSLSLFWTIWKARNRVVFNDESFPMQREKTSFVFLLWLETKILYKIVHQT